MEVIQKCQLSVIALLNAKFFQSDSTPSFQAQSYPPWIWASSSVMTVALLGSGLVSHHLVLPGLSYSVLPSAGQPIKFAHSICAAGMAELHIQDALPEDRGTYTCLAENALGQVSCSARVTVQGRILQAFTLQLCLLL